MNVAGAGNGPGHAEPIEMFQRSVQANLYTR